MSCTEEKKLIVRGEPFTFEFIVEQNNAPLPIAGFSALIQLRAGSRGGRLLNEWSDSSPEIFRNNASGLLTLTLPADFTQTLDFNVAYLDLLLSSGSGVDGFRSDSIVLTLYRGVTQID